MSGEGQEVGQTRGGAQKEKHWFPSFPDASLGPESAPSHLVVHKQIKTICGGHLGQCQVMCQCHYLRVIHHPPLCPGSGQQEGTECSGSLLTAYFLEQHGLAICTHGMFMSQGYLTSEGACYIHKMEN